MDFRAAFVFLVLTIAPAACKSIPQSPVLSETNTFIQQRIEAALHKLNLSELLLTTSCPTINVSQPADQQPSPAGHLGPFLCYTLNLSKETPEVSEELDSITQCIGDATSGTASRDGCSLPAFTEEIEKYEFLHCLLNLLKQQILTAQI